MPLSSFNLCWVSSWWRYGICLYNELKRWKIKFRLNSVLSTQLEYAHRKWRIVFFWSSLQYQTGKARKKKSLHRLDNLGEGWYWELTGNPDYSLVQYSSKQAFILQLLSEVRCQWLMPHRGTIMALLVLFLGTVDLGRWAYHNERQKHMSVS